MFFPYRGNLEDHVDRASAARERHVLGMEAEVPGGDLQAVLARRERRELERPVVARQSSLLLSGRHGDQDDRGTDDGRTIRIGNTDFERTILCGGRAVEQE